jgi:hypothetical protein
MIASSILFSDEFSVHWQQCMENFPIATPETHTMHFNHKSYVEQKLPITDIANLVNGGGVNRDS